MAMPNGFDAQRTSNENLLAFATQLQQVREDERANLARELHDELGAILMAAKLDVACLDTRLSDHSPEVNRRLTHLGETLNRGLALKRRIVEGLCPSTLANLGLVASLEILGRDFALTSGIEITTALERVELDERTQLAVYRLVQEALTNTAKYAGAKHSQIHLATRDGQVVVTVTDDGIGFDVGSMTSAQHGLLGIQHRVEACGGHLKVTSVPCKGTCLVALLPVACSPEQEMRFGRLPARSCVDARAVNV
jgi:signal transduction histidine kinase